MKTDKQHIASYFKFFMQNRRKKTPSVLQIEGVECGAAALGSILGYWGKHIPLEQLRIDCGISRDGSKAGNILKAATTYGLTAKGYKMSTENLKSKFRVPVILFWNFNHFLVLEGFGKHKVFLNDPAAGPRTVSYEEFDESYTGIALICEPGKDFRKGDSMPGMIKSLKKRLVNVHGALSLIMLVSLMLVVPGLLLPTFTKIFIDEILIYQLQDWFRPLIVGMVITTIIAGILTYIQQTYLLRLETRLSISMSSRFFWHVLKLPVNFFQQRFAGEIGSRVMLNDKIAGLLSGRLTTTVLNLVMIPFYAFVMFQYDVALTLIVIFISAINFVVMKYVHNKRVVNNKLLLQQQGKLMGITMYGIRMIETLKASGSENDYFAKWSGNFARVINTEQKLGYFTQVLSAFPPLLTSLITVSVLAYGSLQVIDGKLTVGELVAFQLLMMLFVKPVNDLVSLGASLQEIQGDLSRVDDVHNYKTEDKYQARDKTGIIDSNFKKLNGFITFKNVSFGYNKLEEPLIKDFNLELGPGKRVALVGSTGSGKSTISNLLAGLFEPWDGEILFDGKNKSSYPKDIIHHSLAMVSQDINIFNATIKENIALWDTELPEKNLIRAAKDAVIHDDISSLGNRYDTMVEEGGKNFSGGQKQRIEIARALAIDPSILILDEATSALDPKTEEMIDRNIRRRGCTCLIVAHRLSTIRDCDEIIVLDKGKVVERGTHEELARNKGLYFSLISNY